MFKITLDVSSKESAELIMRVAKAIDTKVKKVKTGKETISGTTTKKKSLSKSRIIELTKQSGLELYKDFLSDPTDDWFEKYRKK